MFVFLVISQTSKLGRSSKLLTHIKSYIFDCFFRILGNELKISQNLVQFTTNISIFFLALLLLLQFWKNSNLMWFVQF